MTPSYTSGCDSPEYFAASAEPSRWVSHFPLSWEMLLVSIWSSGEYRWFMSEPPFVIQFSFGSAASSSVENAGADVIASEEETVFRPPADTVTVSVFGVA